MNSYDRRVFVKQSAMLAAAAAAGRLGLHSAFAQAGRPELPFFKAQKGVDVIAHRGGKAKWPEETLYAFREAVKLGVDVLDMDVQRTSDGVLVLMHDPKVDRTTDGEGNVPDLRYAGADPKHKKRRPVGELDAGYDWPTECKTLPPPHCRPAECDLKDAHPFRGKGIKVPRLEEVFEEFKAAPGVRMVIEIKPFDFSTAAPFCALLNRTEYAGLKDRVLVASFNDAILGYVRDNCKGVATSAGACQTAKLSGQLSGSELLNLAPCKFITLLENLLGHNHQLPADFAKPKFDAIQMPAGRVTKQLVARAHSADFGLKVHAWTVNDDAQMLEMLEAGVDGIITDCPDRLLQIRADWLSKSGR